MHGHTVLQKFVGVVSDILNISKPSLIVWNSKINLMGRYDFVVSFDKMLKTSIVFNNIVHFCTISNKPVSKTTCCIITIFTVDVPLCCIYIIRQSSVTIKNSWLCFVRRVKQLHVSTTKWSS
jgi:hypothetical protein